MSFRPAYSNYNSYSFCVSLQFSFVGLNSNPFANGLQYIGKASSVNDQLIQVHLLG